MGTRRKTIHEAHREWFVCQFIEFEKDGACYLIPCDGRLGIQAKPREVWKQLRDALTQSLEHITDEEVDAYNARLDEEMTQQAAPTPLKSNSMLKGFVYVIQGDAYYKIGYTNDPYKRLKPITVNALFPLKTLVLIPTDDMKTTEQTLHTQFASKHIRGEWFNLSDEDLEAIRHGYTTLDPTILKAD
jgi:hypothetical protein